MLRCSWQLTTPSGRQRGRDDIDRPSRSMTPSLLGEVPRGDWVSAALHPLQFLPPLFFREAHGAHHNAASDTTEIGGIFSMTMLQRPEEEMFAAALCAIVSGISHWRRRQNLLPMAPPGPTSSRGKINRRRCKAPLRLTMTKGKPMKSIEHATACRRRIGPGSFQARHF